MSRKEKFYFVKVDRKKCRSVDDELGAWIPPEKWIEDTGATCIVDSSGVATFSTDTRSWTNADGAVVADPAADVVRRHCVLYLNSPVYAFCISC